MAASKARHLELCETLRELLIALSIMAASKASHEGLYEILEMLLQLQKPSIASLINLFRWKSWWS